MKFNFLILFLLLTFALAAPCFDIEIKMPEKNLGVKDLVLKVKNNQDARIRVKSVELYLSEPQNFTNYTGGVCAQKEGKKCGIFFWVPEQDLWKDQSYDINTTLEMCPATGSKLSLEVSATADCPLPVYTQLASSGFSSYSYSPLPNYTCSENVVQGGTVENVTIWGKFETYGGGGDMLLVYPYRTDNLTSFDSRCSINPCGSYKKFEYATTPALGFSICGNFTRSRLDVANITSWWRTYTYGLLTQTKKFDIDIIGSPVLSLTHATNEKPLEKEDFNITTIVSAVCGNVDTSISLSSSNETRSYLRTGASFDVHLKNREHALFSWIIKANFSGDINYEIKFGSDYTENETIEMKISKNPHGCEEDYIYCGDECKKVECEGGCETGEVFCSNGVLYCESLVCGSKCPDDQSKICNSIGDCVDRGQRGWDCACLDMCLPFYQQGGTCYFKPTCSRSCSFEYEACSGTCKSSGCCGDGICSPNENCMLCYEDCSCDDGDSCTDDVCTGGTCTYRNSACGTPCPDGKCNGLDQCLPDICCKNEDCNITTCQRATCIDFTCNVENLDCYPCIKGFCFEGECKKFRNVGDACECNSSCELGAVCGFGQHCSYCGNYVCDPGECQTCREDCKEVVCPSGVFIANLIKIAIVVLVIVLFAAIIKVIT